MPGGRGLKIQAVSELVFAGAIWGFGFVATIWALRSMGPLAMTGWRFILAAILGIGLAVMIPSLRKHITLEQLKLSFIPGILVCLMLGLQTWGLKFTTATKGGFITTLYVLMVPLLEKWWRKRPLPRFHFFYVALGLLGVALICDLPGDILDQMRTVGPSLPKAVITSRERWNIGDFLTFLCAIAASAHIIYLGVIQKKIGSAFVFNCLQSFWAALIPLALAFAFEETPHLNWQDLSLPGFLSLLFASTMIAFALQVRAQKVLSPSLSSLLFLLESPFAAFFAVLFLHEKVSGSQWFGAALIMLATVSSVWGTTGPD